MLKEFTSQGHLKTVFVVKACDAGVFFDEQTSHFSLLGKIHFAPTLCLVPRPIPGIRDSHTIRRSGY